MKHIHPSILPHPRRTRWTGLLALAGAIAIGGAASARAAEPLTVRATLAPTQAAVGDVVTLDIRAVAAQNGDIAVELPELRGLAVLGRSESTQMSMSWTSGGQSVRREKRVRVELSVESPGRKTIPPITARLGAATAATSPLTLEVAKAAKVAPVAPKDGKVVPPEPSEARLFIRYRLSRGAAWLGQQVLLDLEIFADPGLGFQVDSIPDPPDLDGFWREVLDRPKRLVPRTEQVEGRSYQVFRAWRLALFPLEAGTRTLEPIAVSFRIGGGGLFGGGRRARRRTRALELEVRPLPEAGRPAGFSASNVGTYDLSARVEDRQVTTGKAVVLKLSLSGEGNIKSARLPEVEAVDGFRVFPPTVSDDVTLGPTGVRGTKTAEILLVPQKPGTLEVPGLRLPIFDPLVDAYQSLTTEPIAIEVTGEPIAPAEDPGPAAAPAARRPTERRPLRYRAELDRPPHLPWRSAPWWAAVAAGPLLWAGAAASRRAGERLRSKREDPTREIEAEARARLSALEAAGRGADRAAAAAAFAEAFHARARLRLGRSLRGLTSEQIGEAVQASGADPDYARDLARALDAASFARYAPGTSGSAETAGTPGSAETAGTPGSAETAGTSGSAETAGTSGSAETAGTSGSAETAELVAGWTELVRRLDRLDRGARA